MQRYNDVYFFILSDCYDKQHIQNQLMKKWFILSKRLQSTIDTNQVRSPGRTGIWSRNQVPTLPTGWLSLWLCYPAQDLLSGAGTTHSGLAPPLLTNHQENAPTNTPQDNLINVIPLLTFPQIRQFDNRSQQRHSPLFQEILLKLQ